MSKSWNFALAESGIVAHVKVKTQSGPGAWARAVGTRSDLAAVTEDMQLAPAVYVVYDGFTVAAASEFDATLNHRWIVVVAVSHAAQQRESEPRNQEAGPYVQALLEALLGFVPPSCQSGLVPVTPPKPHYSEARFAYYPLAFNATSYHCKTF